MSEESKSGESHAHEAMEIISAAAAAAGAAAGAGSPRRRASPRLGVDGDSSKDTASASAPSPAAATASHKKSTSKKRYDGLDIDPAKSLAIHTPRVRAPAAPPAPAPAAPPAKKPSQRKSVGPAEQRASASSSSSSSKNPHAASNGHDANEAHKKRSTGSNKKQSAATAAAVASAAAAAAAAAVPAAPAGKGSKKKGSSARRPVAGGSSAMEDDAAAAFAPSAAGVSPAVLDPHSVMISVHADLDKELREEERKRALARAHRNKPLTLPRDERSKEIYAQRYRLKQERTAFIQQRHRDFYLHQIVDRYPTPRFPYLDNRNLALWTSATNSGVSEQESRRQTERILPEARRKMQEETMRRIVSQEARLAAAKESAAKAAEASSASGKHSASSAAASEKKKPGRRTGRKKSMPISAAAAADAADHASTSAEHSTPQHKPRQTQNSLNDSFALEQALLLSTTDATMHATEEAKQQMEDIAAPSSAPTAAAASSSSSSSSAAGAAASSSADLSAPLVLPSSLSSLSFARTTPMLRPGNFILLDNPDVEDWEPARIIAVNKSRTRIQIEPHVEQPKQAVGSRSKLNDADAAPAASPADGACGPLGSISSVSGGGGSPDSSRPAPYFFLPTTAPTSKARWIDLDSNHFFEYIDVVWAKAKGFDWWPAELIEEVDCGVVVHPTNQAGSSAPPEHTKDRIVQICFCEDNHTIVTVSAAMIQPYADMREQYSSQRKLRKRGFEESMLAADEAWANHLWQNVLDEHARRLNESHWIHAVLSAAPSFFFGKKISTFWPLDETWYSGTIKQYNLHTRKHCILYSDGLVEWLDLAKEKIAFTSGSATQLAVGIDAQLPTDLTLQRALYKTFQFESYVLQPHAGEPAVTVLKDLLPDFVPRAVEQVDALPAADPKTRPRQSPAAASKALVPSSASASSAAVASAAAASSVPPTDLKSLACWECGLDLERWNGPGLLSAKYGGSSKANVRSNDASSAAVEIISCGRCTKVVHSFCLNLMLKRKNQTERAQPSTGAADASSAVAGGASTTLTAKSGGDNANGESAENEDEKVDEAVLPPHLSCTFANPRCPDCLRCEHCQLISNKNSSVEDMVTCDVCLVRVHLQCADPPFDPNEHKRPDDGGWVCMLCVKCRCCGATHSKGGQSQLPPLPPPPCGQAALAAGSSSTPRETDGPSLSPVASMDIDAGAASPPATAATTVDGASSPGAPATAAASSSPSPPAAVGTPMDLEGSARVAAVPASSAATDASDVTVGAGALAANSTASAAPATGESAAADAAAAPSAPASAPAPKRKKTKSRKLISGGFGKKKGDAAGATAGAEAKPAELPFSKRFISKWVDTDEEDNAYWEREDAAAAGSSSSAAAAASSSAGFEADEGAAAPKAKRSKLDHDSAPQKGLVTFTWGKIGAVSDAVAVSDPIAVASDTDKSFWQWTNSFTVCQPCGYRLEKRKFCPICTQIYDNRTTDPMVQCDSCERWVHIACDPNARQNEDKLNKDNTLYHCSECLRRERSNEMTLILDELISQDRNKNFLHPVNESIAPSYFLTIKTPMDFSTIAMKLMELQYTSLDAFKYDLNLIWRNAKDYNAATSGIHRAALRLQAKSTDMFKALAAKHSGAGGLFDQSMGRIDDEEEESKRREAERLAKEAENKRRKEAKMLLQPQYPHPPRVEYFGTFLSTDDLRLREVDTCLLCGSIGDETDLLFCVDCGECAHTWCYSTSLAADGSRIGLADEELSGYHSIFHRLTAEQRAKFRCPSCEVCNVCGQQDKKIKAIGAAASGTKVLDQVIACEHCHGVSHFSCVPYLRGQLPRQHLAYKCPRCVVCRCCQRTHAGNNPTDQWSPDFTLCAACWKLYSAGHWCQVCDLVYKPNDDATPMMCCDSCSRWVHMECDGLKLDAYLSLTQDDRRSYFCPDCRHGQSPHALADKANREQARRLASQSKRQEKNKLSLHIGNQPMELAPVTDELQLYAQTNLLLERTQAKRRRMLAMQRHRATVTLNETLTILRDNKLAIPPIQESVRLAAQQGHALSVEWLVEQLARHGTQSQHPHLLCLDLANIESPAARRLAEQEAALRAYFEQCTTDVPKLELEPHATRGAAAAAAAAEATKPIDEVPQLESALSVSAPVAASSAASASATATAAASATPAAASSSSGDVMDIDTEHGVRGDALTALLASGSSSVEAIPASIGASTSAAAAAQAGSTGDWRVCALCRKVGDREGPGGEGRLLAALCPTARWIHVQCALWSDKVSTNVRGQLMGVPQQLRKFDDLVCDVCNLPGASLRCKKSANCPRYHFGCAQTRGCFFTLDKDFYCERHSVKVPGDRAPLDKICRKLTIRNEGWNRRELFSMRITEPISSASSAMAGSADADEIVDTSVESKRADENALADYFSDYENQEEGVWKRGRLSFLSKEAERALEEDHQAPPLRRTIAEQNSAATACVFSARTEKDRERRLKNSLSRAHRDKDGVDDPEEHADPKSEDSNDDDEPERRKPAARNSTVKKKEKRSSATAAPAVKTEEDEPAPMDTDETAEPQVKSEPASAAAGDGPTVGAGSAAPADNAAADSASASAAAPSTAVAAASSGSHKKGSKPSRRQQEKERLERRAALAAKLRELDRLRETLTPVAPSSTHVFFKAGALAVMELGEIVPESPFFHTPEILFPLGYKSVRLYWSYMRPGMRATYSCEVLAMQVPEGVAAKEAITLHSQRNVAASTQRPLPITSASQFPTPHRLAPVFRITCSDDARPSSVIQAASAPLAWRALMRLFPSFDSRNSVRPKMRSGDTWAWGLGGGTFFGFTLPQVQAQLERLPQADRCRKYRFRQVEAQVERQKLEAIEREAKGLSELQDDSDDELTSAKAGDKKAAAGGAASEPVVALPINGTGCARTEGYSKSQIVQFRAAEGGTNSVAKSGSAATAAATAQTQFASINVVADDLGGRRRKAMLSSGTTRPSKEMSLAAQYRVMKASLPRARVAHSVIHEWGLFANQDLEEGAMVIEYLGELIRPRMADVREKFYEDNGVDSCYMFRIDDDYIVDSTKRGNISRFINHSCDVSDARTHDAAVMPNCKTDIVDNNGAKKIVVLADRPIAKDEEICYNYFFASENEKIHCNCGAINCAGRLN